MTPESLTLKGRFQDTAGSLVDRLFLLPPKLARPFMPRRSMGRQAYEHQLDFYITTGYVDRPASFFSLPAVAPPFSVIEEKPYHDGRYQVVGYESGYVAKNPLLRDAYHAHTANRQGYLVRWFHGDRPRKTVLCHHGYMLGEPRQARRMFRVRHLFSAGLDVALFIAPFHWRRRTGSLAKRGFFLQPDNVGMTCECMGQSMHDLAAVFHILFATGAPRVGLIGASLGGYNTALFAALSDLAAFGAMMVPAVDFSRPLGPDTARHTFPVDAALREKISRVWTLHSPLNFSNPRLTPEKLLVVASRGDQLCPFEYVRRLCDQWRITDRHFLSGGHWLVFDRERGRAWYAFLARMGFLEDVTAL